MGEPKSPVLPLHHRVSNCEPPHFSGLPMPLTSSLLKNTFVAFFNLARLGTKFLAASKITITSPFWARIHAIAQPAEYFNRLPSWPSACPAGTRLTGRTVG